MGPASHPLSHLMCACGCGVRREMGWASGWWAAEEEEEWARGAGKIKEESGLVERKIWVGLL